MFRRLRNLYRINKLYGLFRDLIEKPETRLDQKHWIKLVKTMLAVTEVQEMMQGYKTYVVAAMIAAASVGKYLGYIDEVTYHTLLGLLGAGGAATLAAKINRKDKTQDGIR